jgi:fatty acid synthase subunit beta
MAMRTLKAKYDRIDDSSSKIRAILCHSRNGKEIYYQYENAVEAPVVDDSPDDSLAPTLVPVVAIPTAAPSTSSGPALSIEDVPIPAIDILLVIIAQKLKKKVDEILISKTIKDLVGGKSTMQNKILGDLQQEFTSAPGKRKNFRLRNLVLLGTGFSGDIGKYSTGLVSVARCLVDLMLRPLSHILRKHGA